MTLETTLVENCKSRRTVARVLSAVGSGAQGGQHALGDSLGAARIGVNRPQSSHNPTGHTHNCLLPWALHKPLEYSSVKLYTFDPAPNPRRLDLFLFYKGIKIEKVHVDLVSGEQLTEAYRALVPAATVPALVLSDGNVMTEVIGICCYLESLNPSKPLLGTNALEHAQVLSWDHRLKMGVFAALGEILRNGDPSFKGRGLPGPQKVQQIPELCQRGRMRLPHYWSNLDAELKTRQFLTGDTLTLADIDLLVAMEFAAWIDEAAPEHLDGLQSWLTRARRTLGLQH